MSKFGLENKAKQIGVVINAPKGAKHFDVETLDKLDLWLGDCAEDWCYIIHDLDVLEDGTPKALHLHLFARLKVCQRLYTSLNKIADALGYQNEQISIEKCTSPTSLVQYMLHKHNPDKHPYRKEELRTSLEEGELDAILEAEGDQVSVEWFVGICATSKNLVQVIRSVGLPKYQAYRNVILDIWKSLHN